MLIKHSAGLTRWRPALGLVLAFGASALIQARAMKYKPLGSSYVVMLRIELLIAVVAGYFYSPSR